MRRNVVTTLRRRAPLAMSRFDRLPLPLRRWLQQAVLPWSVRSAERLWARALARHGGDVVRALAAMDAAEARTLAREGKPAAAERAAAVAQLASRRRKSA